ncbi:tryptophan synthase subunit alpha [Fusibacter ferrireducens]|uniref:tryptophan synthase n=1 Tax=Fusibacter ferrireducens TaxID=2785058 RepID=A0ABR9ZU49_9FIRM|nr:tryptophan synthase subunit alpha [Fusibacter ferrireducens]MBF4693988.1 tryptophan synthase subunit alpha [Fusibacter ferrireducens]
MVFNKKNWITFYMTADYPNRDRFVEVLDILVEQGMDVLELGIPVENPVLDGVLVRETHRKVLNQGFNGTTLSALLQLIRNRHVTLKVVVMSYEAGVKKYDLLKASSLYDALLCPDAFYSENGETTALVQMYNTQMSDQEIDLRLNNNSFFAYVMSYVGVTGSLSHECDDDYGLLIEKLQQRTDIPIQVGFGIKTPSQVSTLFKRGADGAIIGSELIKIIDENNDEKLRNYVSAICSEKRYPIKREA